MSKFFRKIKFFMSMGLVFVIIGMIAYRNLSSYTKNMNLPSSTEVKEVIADNNSENTTNILLLDNKSDSMIVASVDKTNKNIEFTPVTNTGYFHRGNMENLLNSIVKSVNMNLDKFLQIDTSEIMGVISILGDVCVDIKSEDMKLINNLIPKFYAELNDKTKGEMKLITSPGVQYINEYQLMAYMNVVAKDSDKQKEAIVSLVKSVKNLGFAGYYEVYKIVKPYVETDLTILDMLKLAYTDYEFN